MTSRSVTTIDCEYFKPQYACAYLVQEKDRALFVENNTAHAVPRLLRTLSEKGMSPRDVEYVIITHVHLDHAGGTGALMKACPNATLLAHPRAARHMIDPSRLISSAKQVYGEKIFEQLYGSIEPVEASRVRAVEDGEEIVFGSRTLRFFHTRGHANHHFCIYDRVSEGVFTGDSFGIAYPALQSGGLFIFPSTSPTDFDPIEARLSIQKILATGAKRAYLTHFGEMGGLEAAAEQLIEHLDFSEIVLAEAVVSSLTDAELEGFCEKRLSQYYRQIFEEKGLSSDSELWERFKLDLKLNAAGIAYTAQRSRASSGSAGGAR